MNLIYIQYCNDINKSYGGAVRCEQVARHGGIYLKPCVQETTMGKILRIAADSAKENCEFKGNLRKSPKSPQRKRKSIGESQSDNQERKKVRFSLADDPVPRTSKQNVPVGKSEPDISKRQKRVKGKLPRFMNPELRTIKKSGSIFDKVQLTASGKPNWIQVKKESSKLKKVRKERKQTHFEIIMKAKKIWEVARRETLPVEQKAQEIVKLHGLVQNNLDKLVYAHDTSRIVQGLLKLGSPSVRTAVSEELAPVFLEMMQKKFSVFVIKRILQYGDQNAKQKVFNSMKGSILKLLSNSVSAPLVEYVYSQFASTNQKVTMEKEFLGNFLFTTSQPTSANIATILSELSAENKVAAYKMIKENIIKICNKGNFSSSVLCSVTVHFFEFCSEADKKEIVPLFSPHILDFVTTKPGSRLGVQCIWFADKKAKKQIVKQLKGNVLSLSSDNSFWIILAVLDSVDDTVLLNKVIVSEIANNATALLKTEQGRKVLLYLVAHRDTVYFHPKDIEYLKGGDSCSLKSLDKKREELSPVINILLLNISKDTEIWMENAKIAMITLATLKTGQGERLSEALEAVARYICSNETINNQPIFEHAGMNLIIKKLLNVDVSRKDDSEKFSIHLASVINTETIQKWIKCTRGAFLIAGILEAKSDKAISILLTKLTIPLRKQICETTNAGAKVLVRLLKEAAPDMDDWELLTSTES